MNRIFVTASALALATAGAPAAAEDMQMPGMTMPAPPAPANKKAKPSPAEAPTEASGAADHAAMAMAGHSAHMSMTGALGAYSMNREASGTSWQPDSSEHMGLHVMSGGWTLMAHGTLNFVADDQGGARGRDKAFVSGHFMGVARRQVGPGTLQLRTILSPDPLMGKRGYPLLLASGETANGRDRLIDRQHPHDFFGELSASYSLPLSQHSSLFVYAGLPGEPAFGPPAYFHREAIMDSPEAPITHHWLNSTHVSEGVVTAGLVLDRVKVEVSRFNAREPDQHRWDIETGPLNSTSARLSWNPTRTLSLQASWATLKDPEQLEPGVDQKRVTASALYGAEIAPGWRLAGTVAWGRRTMRGHHDDAWAVEAALKHGQWTAFGRAERTENRELLDIEDGPAFRVGKVSLGAVRDFRLAEHFSFGAGGLVSLNVVPDGLAGEYGGNNPAGAMAFVRLKLD